jgi:hypothetical protein
VVMQCKNCGNASTAVLQYYKNCGTASIAVLQVLW